VEPIDSPRRVEHMKRISTLHLWSIILATLFLVACGSDSSEVTSGASDQDDSVDSDLPIDPNASLDDDIVPGNTEPDLPTGPLGGGGPLVTVEISITHPDAEDVTYIVSCLGDTATVSEDVGIDGFGACNQLGQDDVRARLLNGPPSDQACTEIYGGPDVARIVGTYEGVDGPAVDTTIDRSNGCGIDEWERLLSEVLPDARGLQ
jgi:hypothetical protein